MSDLDQHPKQSELFESHYFSSSVRKILCCTGLWVGQGRFESLSRRFFFVLVSMLALTPQIIAFKKIYDDSFVNFAELFKILATGGGLYFIFAVFLGTWYFFKKLTIICKNINNIWELIKDKDELQELEKRTIFGQKMLKTYLVNSFFCCLIYSSLPAFAPIILDHLFPLKNNCSRTKPFILDGEYFFIDKNDNYWSIYIFEFTIAWLIFIMNCTYISYYTIVTHQCIAFICVLNLRLRSMKKFVIRRTNELGIDVEYCRMQEAIYLHKRIIKLTNNVTYIYNWFFLQTPFLTIFVLSIGANCLISYINEPSEFLRLLEVYAIAIFNYVFIIIGGQMMTNSSEEIFKELYNLEWYNYSIKTQKLVLMMMMNSKKPIKYGIANVYEIDLEYFGMMLRISISYITVVASLRAF